MSLFINGSKVSVLSFPPTGDWGNWKTISIGGISLSSGSNTVTLSADEGSAGANIDQMVVSHLEAISPKTVRVFLLGRQSNMAGRNGNTGTFPAVLQQNQNVQIKVFGETDRDWTPVKSGLSKDNLSSGPELVFSWDMSKYYPYEDIAILKGATGGTTIYNNWRPSSLTRTGDQGILYDEFIREVLIGISELKEGYAENNTYANEYEANITALINDFRADFNLPHLPFVIARIDDTGTLAYRAAVRSAQVNVAQNLENVYVFSTDNYNTDGLHYYISGYLRMEQTLPWC